MQRNVGDMVSGFHESPCLESLSLSLSLGWLVDRRMRTDISLVVRRASGRLHRGWLFAGHRRQLLSSEMHNSLLGRVEEDAENVRAENAQRTVTPRGARMPNFSLQTKLEQGHEDWGREIESENLSAQSPS